MGGELNLGYNSTATVYDMDQKRVPSSGSHEPEMSGRELQTTYRCAQWLWSLCLIVMLIFPFLLRWQGSRPRCPTLWDPINCSIKATIALVMPSSHLILWCPLLLLPSIFPSIKDFSSELAIHIRWPKYWSFSFSLSPSSEYSGLIFLKVDWFDLLAVQGTFRSLLQHHSSKTSILWLSAFF